MPVASGAHTSLHFQQEAAFGDGGNGTNNIFGANQTLETAEATNNGTRIYMPGSNRSVEIKEGTFDGAWSVSFDLSNPDWLYALFGSPSTGTYSGDPEPIAIHAGNERTGTARVLEGCVASSASIDPTVDENTTPVTLEGFYSSESQGTVVSQTSLSHDVYDFADATLSVGGTTKAPVQNASLSLETSTEPINQFGTRFAQDYLVGAFEPTVSFGKIKTDEASAESVYGGSTSTQENITTGSGVTLDFTSAGGDSITFNCSATFPESYNVPYGDVTSAIEEEINRQITDVTVDTATV